MKIVPPLRDESRSPKDEEGASRAGRVDRHGRPELLVNPALFASAPMPRVRRRAGPGPASAEDPAT